MKKLNLNRETLRSLSQGQSLEVAAGGLVVLYTVYDTCVRPVNTLTSLTRVQSIACKPATGTIVLDPDPAPWHW